MGQSPTPALLRLREGDVVRLCGLAAAGDGLRLAGQLQTPHRQSGRLTATCAGAPGGTWAEVVEAEAHLTLRWGCDCSAGRQATEGADASGTPPGEALACVHVAALLSAWLRHPADFADMGDEPSTADPEGGRRGLPPTPVTASPGTSSPGGATQTGLRGALVALPARQRDAIREQVLGATGAMPADASTEALAATLAAPDRVARAVDALEAPALALLRAIRVRGGSLTAAELDGLGTRHRGGRGAVVAARQQLEARGLLFSAPGPMPDDGAQRPEHADAHAADIWFIPNEIARAIGVDLPLQPLPAVAAHGPPRLDSDEQRAAGSGARVWVRAAPLRQLCAAAALLAHVGPARARVSGAAATHRGPSRGRHGAALPAATGDPPTDALAGWARATHLPAGLLRLAWRVRHAGATASSGAPSIEALARLPSGEWALALRGAFRGWLERATYEELSDLTLEGEGVAARCDPRHPALRRPALAEENARARRFVVELVGRLREGAWYALDDLLDLVWWVHPSFLRERQRVFSEPAWWLVGADGSAGGTRPLDVRLAGEWRRAEGRYVGALLEGPLHWWGVVDLAGAVGTGARAVRLTPMGAYLVGHISTPPATVAALASGWGPAALPTRGARREASDGANTGTHSDIGLAVQPLAAHPALLDTLGQWARVTGLAGDRLLYRFSRDLACRAFDAGIDPAPLLALLREADARDHTRVAPVAADVLEGWHVRYGTSRIETGAALLEAVNAPSLHEALALAPAIAARCRLIAPTTALVPADAVAILARALDARGFVV